MPHPNDVVLIVEDNQYDADLITHMLTRSGVDNWQIAADGPTALAVLITTSVCLMLVDLTLPGMDGFELITEAREQYPKLPIVVVTGQDDEISRENSQKLGVEGYMVKPVSFDNFHMEILRCNLRLTVTQRGT